MKILLVDPIHPHFVQRMNQANFECIDASRWSRDEIQGRLKDFEGMVIRSRFPVDKEFLSHSNKLRFIARAGAGMENIDVSEAEKRNIVCLNAPEGNRDAVAEHVIAMLLGLMNKITRADAQVRQFIWEREANRGEELSGKTFGIIGFGNTGSTLAKKLTGFESCILAYDKYLRIDKNTFPYVQQVEWKDILNHADIISLHVPLTDETQGMADDDFFNGCRKKIWFVNTSRGRVAKTASIVRALKCDKIKGACLDVFEFEDSSFEKGAFYSNPDFEYLRQSDKVILTPHIAGWSEESSLKIASVLADKIVRLLKNCYDRSA